MSGDNRDLIESYFKVVWIDGEWDRVYEFVAPDFVNHGSFPGYPTTTIEDGRRIDEIGRLAFPDIEFTLARVAAAGDMAARHWTATATHRGAFMNVPATGRRIFMQGMVFSRIEDGRIKEEWRIIDNTGLIQQLTAPSEAGGDGATEERDRIIELENELQSAVQRQDRAALERLLAPDFRLATPRTDRPYIERAAWIDTATGPFLQAAWSMHDPVITVDGDTAIVATTNEQQATHEGRPAHSRFYTTDVWVRRGGVWRLLSRHPEWIGD